MKSYLFFGGSIDISLELSLIYILASLFKVCIIYILASLFKACFQMKKLEI